MSNLRKSRRPAVITRGSRTRSLSMRRAKREGTKARFALVLSLHTGLEWRGQDGQNETEQPDHSANLGDSITASTRMRFSVRTPQKGCLAFGRTLLAATGLLPLLCHSTSIVYFRLLFPFSHSPHRPRYERTTWLLFANL